MVATAAQKKGDLLSIGMKAPDFSVSFDSETAETISSDSIKGWHKVIYFYPKDDTPGCSKESQDFRDMIDAFKAANTMIIGVSRDSVESHDKFRKKYSLPFALASDESGKMCEDYGVWVEKSMYGKSYMGIDRSTFLIDKDGIVRQVWRKVKVPGHVQDVLNAAQKL